MNKIAKIDSLGQSLWYDNIQRSLLKDGSMERMILEGRIKGVTSNPSIFQKAIAKSKDYDLTLKPMAWSGLSAESIFWRLAVEDIQNAADLFLPVYERTKKKDGYVSLEVNPLYANDTDATIQEAKKLWNLVDRPNLMIKIPATVEGLPAITQCIADGININVTLIFSIERYGEVIDAYLNGLEKRLNAGNDVTSVASVASFFVSRLDTKIDGLLENLAQEGKLSQERLDELTGRAAVANARLAFRLFEDRFFDPRFQALKNRGAQIQRPLWASTSTKNPKYRDVIYVEELIGCETVNTVPPATLDAFFDHGNIDLTIHNDLDGAHKLMEDLADVGISLEQVTLELEKEGVKQFADAFTQLLEAVEGRRIAAVAELGSMATGVKKQVERLQTMDFSHRLYQKDPTLWTEDSEGQAEIKKRMNWLTAPTDSQSLVPLVKDLYEQCQSRGLMHAVLLGMGGSSLAPEVLELLHRSDLGNETKGLELIILDSTDPEQVLASEKKAPIDKTLFIVASKSGTTAEINAFLSYFWSLAQKRFGTRAGEHFIAITDPGTKLEELARSRGFWKIFSADPQVGGRNSALTAFGLVPAALAGWDVEKLLKNARAAAESCSADKPLTANPGVILGAILGSAAVSGKDKITLITDSLWTPFGAWLEQLIAESSGKNGKGIVPITDEPLVNAVDYGNDRLFVYLRESGEQQESVKTIQQAGHPVITLDIFEKYDLGGQFYLWEIATATACSILGVNSFDQPDVQDAKTRTVQRLEDYRKNGKFPEVQTVAELKFAKIVIKNALVTQTGTLPDVIDSFIEKNLRKDNYFAINAFLPRDETNLEILQTLRGKVLKKFKLATTLGFGPRFLHSTGQLHKGGANNGLFLVITAARKNDVEIPEEGISFGIMQRAQALGDLQALEAKGRRVLWIDLAEPDAALLLKD